MRIPFSSFAALRAAAAASLLVLFGAQSLAVAAPSETNQSIPGLADTPGNKASLPPMEHALNGGVLRMKDGLALLDSAVLLKIYYYAYAKQPVDYTAVLTANTQNVEPPTPVVPTAAEKREIDQLVTAARAHPDLLIQVGEIGLSHYDAAHQGFPISNRLFIGGAKFYFDNSPYHYFFADPDAFRELRMADPNTVATLNKAIGDYTMFEMDIAVHVTGAATKDQALSMQVREVRLRDAIGDVLIRQTAGAAP